MRNTESYNKSFAFEFIVLVFIIVSFSSISLAATIEVTAQIGDPGCDLVEAIQSANTDSAVGGCTAGDEADEIQLQGTHILSEPFINPGAPTVGGDAGLPNITTEISITGVSDHVEIKREVTDPSIRFRIFKTFAPLTLNNIIVSGGDVGFPGTESSQLKNGGGIYIPFGSLTLNDSTIIDNIGQIGGGIYSLIANKITINRSHITNNIALTGAAFNLNNVSEEILIVDSTIEGNSTTTGNQNICSTFLSDSFHMIRSSIINNDNGTALRIIDGSLTMLDSTVSGNGYALGGSPFVSIASISGIYLSPSENSTLTVLNSTITDNPPVGSSFADLVFFQGIRLRPPITGTDDSLSVILRNNIISGNGTNTTGGSETGLEIEFIDNGDSLLSENIDFEFTRNVIGHAAVSEAEALNNVIASTSTNLILTSDSSTPTALRDILNPLGSYGGPTKSHTLPADSPAIDYGFTGFVSGIGLDAAWNPGCRGEMITPGGIPPYRNEQRGLSRPIGSACDAGSTEFRDSDILNDCYVIKAANSNVITFCL